MCCQRPSMLRLPKLLLRALLLALPALPASPPLRLCYSSWLWVVLSMKERDILATAGLDALVRASCLKLILWRRVESSTAAQYMVGKPPLFCSAVRNLPLCAAVLCQLQLTLQAVALASPPPLGHLPRLVTCFCLLFCFDPLLLRLLYSTGAAVPPFTARCLSA